MLTLPRSLSLTPDQFAQVCAAKLVFQLQSWARTGDGWSRWRALSDASRLEATAEFPALMIDLAEIWAG